MKYIAYRDRWVADDNEDGLDVFRDPDEFITGGPVEVATADIHFQLQDKMGFPRTCCICGNDRAWTITHQPAGLVFVCPHEPMDWPPIMQQDTVRADQVMAREVETNGIWGQYV